jgi:alkanesulfonate monooxygenase SsuD/methylene tetrahydromethanopterin reductase-like flavin-dependent oxidoreductase (luciferase family)
MAHLDFAYWDAIEGYIEQRDNMVDVYEYHIRLAQKIEELGWHSYFVIEHQNSPASAITSPTVYLTAIARATSRLRVGAMMFQLPFYHPLRLAQDIAMLDQLSHGRVEFGTGIGVHEHEFIRWGMDFYQRAPMSGEVLDLIKMAWTQDEVTYEGKYWHFDEALPQPKPFQKPYPPIWAAAHSDASFEFAARNNYHVAKNLDADDVVARQFELYRTVWRECNFPTPMPRMFLMRNVHVAETDEQAHEEARKYLIAGDDTLDLVRGGPLAKTRIGWGTHPRGMGRDGARSHDAARGQTLAQAAKDYDYNISSGLSIVGSPDTVIRRLQEGQERIGYTLFCTNHQLGHMPPDLVEKSVTLFGREVIPAFQ